MIKALWVIKPLICIGAMCLITNASLRTKSFTFADAMIFVGLTIIASGAIGEYRGKGRGSLWFIWGYFILGILPVLALLESWFFLRVSRDELIELGSISLLCFTAAVVFGAKLFRREDEKP